MLKREALQTPRQWPSTDRWEQFPSRTRIGEFRYVNLRTKQSCRVLPSGAKLIECPVGWERVESKTRPGAYSFFNPLTGQRVRTSRQAEKENQNSVIKRVEAEDDLSSWLLKRRRQKAVKDVECNTPKRSTESNRGSVGDINSPKLLMAIPSSKNSKNAALEWLPGERKTIAKEQKPIAGDIVSAPINGDIDNAAKRAGQHQKPALCCVELLKKSEELPKKSGLERLAQDILGQVIVFFPYLEETDIFSRLFSDVAHVIPWISKITLPQWHFVSSAGKQKVVQHHEG